MNTGESAGCWREAAMSASGSQPTRSRGSKATEEGGAPGGGARSGGKQDLNRGFRNEDEGDYGGEGQTQDDDDGEGQTYEDQAYYDDNELEDSHEVVGDGE